LWKELSVPVYLYGEAARRPERRRLEHLRRGQFEGLSAALPGDAGRRPDIGGPGLHETAGAVAVGVRKFLIAFNVNLATPDLAVAKNIARRVRESSGGLPAVKALGLPLESRALTQVSMNLTDYEQTSPRTAFEAVSAEAATLGVSVVESELIGLIPARALGPNDPERLRISSFDELFGDQEPDLIGGFNDPPIVRIVNQANEIRPHILDHAHVRTDLWQGQRQTLLVPHVMPANAGQHQRFPVE
jgi:glutamate formiminotransferase